MFFSSIKELYTLLRDKKVFLLVYLVLDLKAYTEVNKAYTSSTQYFIITISSNISVGVEFLKNTKVKADPLEV